MSDYLSDNYFIGRPRVQEVLVKIAEDETVSADARVLAADIFLRDELETKQHELLDRTEQHERALMRLKRELETRES